MRPRLQMISPHIGTRYVTHAKASWDTYVRNAYENFYAPFAANEGVDAVIRYMSPGRRRLMIENVDSTSYLITGKGGNQMILSQACCDSLQLHIVNGDSCSEGMELGYYDATDVARFIGQTFSNYRKQHNRSMV